MEEAEARLLQPRFNESSLKSSKKHSAILLLSLLLNAIFLIATVLSVRSCESSYYEKNNPQEQWAEAAIQAAEKAAANLCSGHGNVFVDTMSVNADDGSLACECNDCFSGPDCSVVVPNCASNADSGNPLLFEPYWRANPEMGTTVIPGWYRIGYSPRDGATGFYTEALEAAIRGIHALAGNALTEGRYIAIGTGSMQLINAVIHSLALQDAGRVTSVTAKAPYYNAYKGQTEFFSSPLYTFAGEPARVTGNPSSGLEIEVIASPNNPTGQIQEAPGKNESGQAVVYDHAYYWPHLTPMTKPYDHDIMLFTLSKLTGHAGSRLGWVILKDYELYTNVVAYVMKNTIGVSHDTQLRATQLMRAVMGSYSEPGKNPGKKKGLFHFGYEVLRSRWVRLNAVFQKSDRFSLQTIEPGYCNFFKHVSDPSPGYAWIHCNYKEDVNCTAVFNSAGVTGRPGYEFGGSAGASYVRLSLLKRDSDFDNMIAHLTKLVDS